MTIKEARDIEERFYRISNPSEEDIFLYTEAMDFLIHEESRPEDMMQRIFTCGPGISWHRGSVIILSSATSI